MFRRALFFCPLVYSFEARREIGAAHGNAKALILNLPSFLAWFWAFQEAGF